jgi:hypothetical protein
MTASQPILGSTRRFLLEKELRRFEEGTATYLTAVGIGKNVTLLTKDEEDEEAIPALSF